MKKKLYIVTGITGAVGNALLSRIAREDNAVVYGISRRGKHYQAFLNPEIGFLPTQTFICSLGTLDDQALSEFLGRIDVRTYSSIVYIHALGHFPFEITETGEHQVVNDDDGDGINDLTHDLSYRVFKSFTSGLLAICEKSSTPSSAFIIGSITDKYRLKEHQSWWKTFELVRKYMEKNASSRFGMHIVNVSSIICTHEILTRPYVFIDTDADMRYWLSPEELANFIVTQDALPDSYSGFHEYDLFHKRPDVTHHYFSKKPFKQRKLRELYGTLSSQKTKDD